MDISIFTDGKTTVKHVTENGKHIVKAQNSKTDNAIFYRGSSVERAQKMFVELSNAVRNKVI